MTPALDPGNKQHGTPSPSREFVQPCVLPWESRRPWRRSSSCSVPFGSPRSPPSLSPSPPNVISVHSRLLDVVLGGFAAQVEALPTNVQKLACGTPSLDESTQPAPRFRPLTACLLAGLPALLRVAACQASTQSWVNFRLRRRLHLSLPVSASLICSAGAAALSQPAASPHPLRSLLAQSLPSEHLFARFAS